MTRERALTNSRETASSPSPSVLPPLRLKVQSASGAMQVLEFSGVSQAEAVRRAVARGFVVLALESASAAAEVSTGRESFPLLLFSQELLALLDAGLNLTEALATLLSKERHDFARSVLEQILRALREGCNFSDVLAAQPRNFPAVYVATVRAAERTGDLPQALSRYIAYQIQFETLRKKLVSATIYPIMLLSVGGLVTLFLLGYVVPRFAVVYESSGRDLPWLSAMLLSFGKLVHGHWQVALLVLVAVGALLVWSLSQPGCRKWLLDQMLRLPFFAAQANAFRLSRFYRAVSLLLSAGIALPKALEMVGGLLGSEQQTRLAQSRVAVEQGQPLSVVLVAHALATPVAESLIKVGERSGQMAQMLERTARFADEEFSRWIDWATRLMEPILMTVIGIVIGTVVVLMYLPIFELAGSLQ
ncbi:MAG: type II secretion system F family protein [Zoogloeaceae bacterium]|jgi:general secretion pathway protein F|nr:type II secretion system F family protein [Zoogloeaceae bacterium]